MEREQDKVGEEEVARMVVVLKGISHPLRLRIIMLLCARSLDVSQLVDALEVRQSLVSQHLAHLRLAGLVSVQRGGGRARYSLKETMLRDLVKCLFKCTKQ